MKGPQHGLFRVAGVPEGVESSCPGCDPTIEGEPAEHGDTKETDNHERISKEKLELL